MKIENTLSFIIILLFSSNIYSYNMENPCEKLIQKGNNLDAIKAAKKIKDQYDKNFCLGKAYYRSNMHKLAVKAFNDSEEYAKLPVNQMFSMLYKGISERDLGEFDSSTKTFTKGLETAKLGNSKYLQMERRFLYQLAQNYLVKEQYSDAIDFFAKSTVVSANDNERAEGYDGLSKAYYGNKKIVKAIEYGLKASNMHLKTGAYNEYADGQVRIASYHLADNDPNLSLKVLKKLEKFAKDNGSQYYEAKALLEQSLVFKKKGDTKQSVAKFNSGTSIAKEIGAKDLLTSAN